MLRAVLVSGVLIAGYFGCATAAEMKPPRVLPVAIDWDAARTELAGLPALRDTPAAYDLDTDDAALARLNAASSRQFPGISNSSVPVLVPFDADAAIRAGADQPVASAGGFRVNFFFAGPTGYDAAFTIPADMVEGLSGRGKKDNVSVQISGFSLLYDLSPYTPSASPSVKELEPNFPGIRRTWLESNVRYSFTRYGVPYTVSMLCVDGPARGRWVACRDADRIIARFLGALRLAGGAPQPPVAGQVSTIDRPATQSADFTFSPPGQLIPKTGFRGQGGVEDYTVYANIRFPLAQSPAYANSQSFLNWGNCDFTGRTSATSRKGAPYRCKVNDKPLVFDESVAENRSYPWRDNFCEHRYFFVGQCPGGQGHQGQDIRPASCQLRNEGADRCNPYLDDVVAARDGMILRNTGRESLYLAVNAPGERVRFRYLHMNPKKLDADGLLSGRAVREGEAIGKVGNYDRIENGTTYHLHFEMQVPTVYGWVFVNPYMTLVASYERLIGGRGKEIRDDIVVAAPAGTEAPDSTPADPAPVVSANSPEEKGAAPIEKTESIDTAAAQTAPIPHAINTHVER
jgi:murein DD-endopeptidase MepM/ murein hydrolase activator NlpD